MRRFSIALLAAGLAVPAGSAFAQTMSARRMAMGGVSLGGEAANVAYRAVPAAPGRSSGFTLPIGVAQVLAHPPSLDPGDPSFNVFEIANLVQNPPWNLELNPPHAPSNDVIVSMGRDRLSVDLGDVRRYLPSGDDRIAALESTPALGIGFGPCFAGLAMVTHYENRLAMNGPLHRALADAEPFRPNTEYAVTDSARGQAVAELETGAALPLATNGTNPRAPGGLGLYGGVRVAVLRGIAYGDTRNLAAFTTQDTLFASAPVEFDYTGDFRDAGPAGGGWGVGLDLGAVLVAGGLELGAGANHIGARLRWTGEEKRVARDTTTGDYQTLTVDDHASLSSTLPVELTANAARPVLGTLVAADVTYAMGVTQAHLGLERWFHIIALRAGGRIDAQGALQGAAGTGARIGPVGLDVAVASHGRSFGGGRGLELGVGLALYH